MQIRQVAALAVVFALSACGGGDDGPTTVTGLNGSVSFTYTGGGGGSYSVSGQMPTIQANIGTTSWAAGYRDTPNSGFSVGAGRARGGGRYDAFGLFIQRLTVGSGTISANCDDSTTNCNYVVLVVNASEADENFDFICFVETGSVAVTEISSTRIKGSFSGSGSCVNAAFSTSAFTVANGTYDVPLVATLPQ